MAVMAETASRFMNNVSASVAVVGISGPPPYHDSSDFHAAGGTARAHTVSNVARPFCKCHPRASMRHAPETCSMPTLLSSAPSASPPVSNRRKLLLSMALGG